ncbi:sensor histidine kinase [Oxalobacteraceae bacterium R-40]|uniref:histidine kinase n=1 Tax=Keguizhuia sedimenti TaxID=3064264 RepID=A0ABU1BMU2_9BURK|nr:sensor histidine kinase [Oxalobacteraceae bacterium R-40]
MKLSSFITKHIETILTEWDAFARTLGPAATDMTDLALRDHAKQILQAAAEDIESAQNADQQSKKSKGWEHDERDSAASEHGRIRQEDGFTMIQMVAEYRALRATVLRLWLPHVKHVTDETTTDMLRFNEAIDQAVAESTARYTEQAARTRDTFLAILGHDLRTPLTAMAMAGEYLTVPNVGTPKTSEVGEQVKRSAASMSSMVNDLLEYARTQLGSGIPIACDETDVQNVCQSAIDEVELAHPDCQFELDTTGNLSGSFDSARLRQALINLLSNAVQYRSKEHPVRILASEEKNAIIIQVQNQGPVIPPDSLEAIFNPLVQLAEEGRPPTSLGLGLFIAREITQAHDGTITAESNEGSGTIFTIRLPKAPVQ